MANELEQKWVDECADWITARMEQMHNDFFDREFLIGTGEPQQFKGIMPLIEQDTKES